MNCKTITIKIPEYNSENGLQLEWEGDYSIKIVCRNGSVLLQANDCGLKSLAKHLLCLASKEVPIHRHIHLDEFNSLEDGSSELIIEKIS